MGSVAAALPPSSPLASVSIAQVWKDVKFSLPCLPVSCRPFLPRTCCEPVPLDLARPGDVAFWPGQVAFPRPQNGSGQLPPQPHLHAGQLHDPLPVLLVFHLRGLKSRQQQPLFAEAEGARHASPVLVALAAGFPGCHQREFAVKDQAKGRRFVQSPK